MGAGLLLRKTPKPVEVSGNNMINRTANDDTPEALVAAAGNWKQLRGDWCDCGNPATTEFAHSAYYRDPVNGSHGWMCVNCRGIIQTG